MTRKEIRHTAIRMMLKRKNNKCATRALRIAWLIEERGYTWTEARKRLSFDSNLVLPHYKYYLMFKKFIQKGIFLEEISEHKSRGKSFVSVFLDKAEGTDRFKVKQ